MGRVLVVDHEAHPQSLLAASLGQGQHNLSHALGVEEGRLALRGHTFDCIVTALSFSDGSGFDVLAAAREGDPNVAVVFQTGPGAPAQAIESMRKGAFDFLAKPVDAEVARAVIQRACEHTLLLRENARLKAEVERLQGAPEVARAGNGAGNGNHDRLDLSWIESLPASFDLRGLLASLEKSLIERTLQSTRGAQAEAARRLGLSRSDLSYKLLKYELRKETTAAS